ncbi:TonB-dependent receptor plug domain-containing protein [Niveispirillum sp. KHB5.9]|uniref:TonB-dependent receptor plug domain-containing protein n=1 Tax=Niveispirillum sp. KHB5.9 TaxID=3400269 RepID=UPI003A876776
MHKSRPGRLLLAAGTLPFILTAAPAFAAEDVFTLGQIIVTAPRAGALVGGETLSAAAIRRFNRDSLDEAAKLIPGVTATNSGGSRNERMINVRGFDRFQVPLSIDGIRVYLPAENAWIMAAS